VVDGSINRRSRTMVDLMPADRIDNFSIVDDEVEVSIPDQTVLAPSGARDSPIRDSEETDELEDVDDPRSQSRYRRGYPVGYAAKILGKGKTKFQSWQKEQNLHGQNEWAPFHNQKEWDLVQWLIKNVGQKSIDEYLKLPIASICTPIQRRITNLFQIQEHADLSFHNTYSLMKKIDQLPTGPDWVCDIVNVSGDLEGEDGERMGEDLELWRRNPLECIQELIGNPSFKDKMVFEPAQFFTDEACTNRLIDEAWTGDWWWKAQVSSRLRFGEVLFKKTTPYQKKIPKGGVVAPVILASDKTQLTKFRGDKSAWPVYLTLGNIEKATRRQVRRKMN
jgi:hypothetical protein